MKNILLATDFSENATNAINYAIHLFGTEEVKYTLLNTYVEPRTSTNVMVTFGEILKKESLEGLAKETKTLREKYEGLDLIQMSYYGVLSGVVNKMADEVKYDYAVLGTKGVSALENFIMGSNTLQVVKSVKLPLLVVPNSSVFDGLHRISFAADYEHLDHMHLLDPMVTLAKSHGAEVKIVNVSEEEKSADFAHAVEGFALHGIMDGVTHQFYTEVNSNVVDGLEKFNEEKDIELITMVARQHTFFDRLFHKSVTQEVSKLADVPMLVLHE